MPRSRDAHQRAQEQLQLASEQVDRTEAGLDEDQEPFEKSAGPIQKNDNTTTSATNAYAVTLSKIKEYSLLNSNGTITVTDSALLDSSDITCALGQVVSADPYQEEPGQQSEN